MASPGPPVEPVPPVRSPSQPVKATSESRVAKAFGLEGESWMRHANPLSVWTRFSVLSLLALAIWSRAWIGLLCLIPLALAVVWLFVNPRVFKEPKSTRNWASKGVFGERIWAERNSVTIPEEFRSRVPNLANLYSSIGLLPLAYGLVEFNLLAVVTGLFIVHGAKLWYIDRMVLLFEAMKKGEPKYAAWEYGP